MTTDETYIYHIHVKVESKPSVCDGSVVDKISANQEVPLLFQNWSTPFVYKDVKPLV